MGKRIVPPEEPAEIHEVPLREALEERYLAYALSTIMHRALPDARDGLKPVHRRILYGMRLLRLDPGTAFKKSAKIVGDVMGSFHPHGDQAIYDAMVRLAQDFSSRYPLVDGQGNFGNIDGDNPAAYRYTEARMTDVARLLLEGIDEDGVEFRANYDGQSKEPVVLPGGFPNLLANGAQGIAVGMATSIPPHNAAELCEAALHLIEKPDAKSKALMKWVKGPDFPTGGICVDSKQAIAEAYTTGRGSFRVRARWEQEEGARGAWVVVVTEIPFLVQKSRLIEKVAELLDQKKLPLVGDIRDESAEDVRIVIEPKSKNVDPALMMESLFRLTEARKQDSAEPQRADQGPRPQGGGTGRVPARMARPSARRPDPPQQLPQGADRAPAGSARRPSGRLSEPRQGDQDHPHRGRAQAGPDQGLQAHRGPSRSHPQHAPAQFAPARGDGDPQRGQGSAQGAEGHRRRSRLRGRAVEEGQRAGRQGPRHVRTEDAARQAPHHLRGCARARSRRDGGSPGRTRAGDGRGLRQGAGSAP